MSVGYLTGIFRILDSEGIAARAGAFNESFIQRYGWNPELTAQQLYVLLVCNNTFDINAEARLISGYIRDASEEDHPLAEFPNRADMSMERTRLVLLNLARAGFLIPQEFNSVTREIHTLRKATEQDLEGRTPLEALDLLARALGALKKVGFRNVETMLDFIATFGEDYLLSLDGFGQLRSNQVLEAVTRFTEQKDENDELEPPQEAILD